MKQIDTSDSTFESLILNNKLYVDKTDYLFNLISKGGKYCFFSRPRRFGKTLTVSTLDAIFKGKKELFHGLKIDKLNYNWEIYPVVHIDFSTLSLDTANELEKDLVLRVNIIASSYGIKLPKDCSAKASYNILFEELAKVGKVVILIDEYDSPLSSNIFNPDVDSFKCVIRNFFEVVKASDSLIKFCFITGVTKFSKLSIFSTMNNLTDLSMDDNYAQMLGYSQDELEEYFASNIEKGIKATELERSEYLDKLRDKYDGYKFSVNGKKVYNPVSVGKFFALGGKTFDNYWNYTGSMKLLMDLARRVNFNIATDIEKPIFKSQLEFFDITAMSSNELTVSKYKALLFQTGYLTISKTNNSEDEFYLDYPNDEVREAFSSNILETYWGSTFYENYGGNQLQNAFSNGNTSEAIQILKSIYASVPYQLKNEANYASLFHVMMMISGAEIMSEISTSMGRIDAVLKTEKYIYVIEFKKDSSAKIALNQIKSKEYSESYKAWLTSYPKREIRLVRINFSTKKNNIDDWKEEKITNKK